MKEIQTITRAEVIQEQFPLMKKPKKAFRFEICFNDKELFSSGRFNSPTKAEVALAKYLKGDCAGIFGNLTWRDVQRKG